MLDRSPQTKKQRSVSQSRKFAAAVGVSWSVLCDPESAEHGFHEAVRHPQPIGTPVDVNVPLHTRRLVPVSPSSRVGSGEPQNHGRHARAHRYAPFVCATVQWHADGESRRSSLSPYFQWNPINYRKSRSCSAPPAGLSRVDTGVLTRLVHATADDTLHQTACRADTRPVEA